MTKTKPAPSGPSWVTSKSDHNLIVDIAKRAEGFGFGKGARGRVHLVMDLTACHANGNPLDLKRLLAFPDESFLHDIVGIAAHLNRDTGKLKDGFSPRSTKV